MNDDNDDLRVCRGIATAMAAEAIVVLAIFAGAIFFTKAPGFVNSTIAKLEASATLAGR